MNDDAVRLWEASLEIHRACGAALNLAEERIESRYLSALGRAPNTDLERAFPRGSSPITFAEAAELGLEFATNIRSRLATVAGG
jgi:hypothetical protein